MLTPRFAATLAVSVVVLGGSHRALAQSQSAAVVETPASAVIDTPVAIAGPNAAIGTQAVPRTPGFKDLFRPLGGDFKGLISQRNMTMLLVGTASAIGSHSMDRSLATRPWGQGAVHEALEPGQIVGDLAVQAGAAFATYSVGRLAHDPGIARLGAELFRAQLVAQGTTQAIKFAAHRVRPDGSNYSFPSGHTAATFATATVLQSHYGWKAGAPAYVVASWVAASRVQTDRHYLSDVIAGATLGVLAGRSVTVGQGRARFALAPMAGAGGIGVGFVHVTR
ncbi:MAG: phosphatase PAP2 family protein [Acidobacteriota bacterium]